MAEHRHLAQPREEWIDFPNRLPRGTKTVGMSRERLPIATEPDLKIEESEVTARDDHPIRVRTYQRSSNISRLPLFIYMHGGGYVTGGLETDDPYCRMLARELAVLVLSVEYRLAPEHKFPTGWQDCQDVLRWSASLKGQQSLGVDLKLGFLLGGTSAGANFTAGLAHVALQEDLHPALTGLIFLAGSFCHPDARPRAYRNQILSVDEINDAPGLTRKSIDYFAAKYGAPPHDRRLSPLLFESHQGIAKKAYFAVCGWDPRRDEALLLGQLLKDVNINVKSNVYAGLPHGFWTTCPDLPASQAWERDLVAAVTWLLEWDSTELPLS